VQAAREAARRGQCSNNLKQVGLAIHNFMGEHDQRLPMGVRVPDRCGLFTYLLPYMEEQALYDRIELAKEPWDSANETIYYTPIGPYTCPSYRGDSVVSGTDPTDVMTGALVTYQGVGGQYPARTGVSVTTSSDGDMPEDGAFGWRVKRRARDVLDGLSNTLFVGEFVHGNTDSSPSAGIPGNVRAWLRANRGTSVDTSSCSFKVVEFAINAKVNRDDSTVTFNHLPMGSHHPNGAQFLVGDGSVHFLSENIDLDLYKALATVDGGESANLPD